jgi:voltage-gated potassium channel
VSEEAQPPRVNGYEMFIVGISLLAVFNVVLLYLPFLPQINDVVIILDVPLSVILLLDFAYRLYAAPAKIHYVVRGGGWLDFLGSLPPPALKLFRLYRVVKEVRAFRRAGGRAVARQLFRERAGAVLLATGFLVLVVLEFSGVFMVAAESRAPTANIQTASDALWWAYVTITTVGYGDRFPVTGPGRIVGVVLMTIGVGLFGVLTSFLAQTFLAPTARSEQRLDQLAADVADIKRVLLERDRPAPTAAASGEDASDDGSRLVDVP